MAGFFYQLGRKVAPHVLKARWIGTSLVGTRPEKQEAERSMGGYLARVFEKDIVVEQDRKSRELLDRVTSRLAGRLRKQDTQFMVKCMHYPQVNALAFPGGFVYVSSSLLELCDYDEDTVAFLLAHEFAHIVRGHAARRFLTETVIRMVSSRPVGRTPATRALAALLTRLAQTQYSQEQESEADRFAVHLTASARYRPEAGVALFERLATAGTELSVLGQFFSSHPTFKARIAAVREEHAAM